MVVLDRTFRVTTVSEVHGLTTEVLIAEEMNGKEEAMKKLKTVALWLVSTLLAMLFLAAGAWKFLDPAVADQFAHWGYPEWVRPLIAILEIGGGLILLFPSVAWEGAAILAIVMAGAVVTLVRSGDPLQALLPAVVLGVVTLVVYFRHPRSSLMQRLTTATDWVAEREIAEQHRWLAGSKH